MQIEHITRVGFAARRTTQQQRNLAIGPSLLGQIVVNDQGIFTDVTEVFAHRATGVRGDELHSCRIRSGGGNDDGVFQRAVLFQRAYHVGDRRSLLANSHVDTGHALTLLVQDSVHCDSGLTRLTVTNDQLTLTTADRHHGVDRLDTGLQRLGHRLTPDHARCNFFDFVGQLVTQRTFAVDRLTQGVNDTTLQLRTDRHFQNAARALDGVAF